jgi:DNA-binding response OmpR family regulator
MRVLIVEDEPGVARGVERALVAEGFAVDHEADGLAGLKAARSGTYDVIVLDILLPSMNGYRVCGTLRDGGDWTPILMLTAKDGEHDEAEGLELGADDYMVKPFHMVVLVARIRALLRRPRFAGSAPFTIGDLRLDPVRHRCWRGDVEIELTARERDVLAHLMAHDGDAVSKAQLVDNVWGEDFAGDPNIVEVYVRHLRRKIDIPFGEETIETIRGVGYRVRPGSGAGRDPGRDPATGSGAAT